MIRCDVRNEGSWIYKQPRFNNRKISKHLLPANMSPKKQTEVLSKQGESIEVGDHVYTPFRGGRHEGDVEKIVRTAEEAKKENVKNPPKVLFTDQNGKFVSHNPGTLDIVNDQETE
ncbi:hypothetical protein E1B28_008337 [Marasmius oreades]|uniref:Hypervirulence associated protein TUDOR domain-containing protein n=1 Tax=Marasmius oreades TaxID=181124 RepID=A0A9P7RYB7_9AGAR|nr:uncharacterized protein E1B28_008337 [Marasmius oreades]KAG7091947.1 hypothetical protein E1B28_008337 [Marasmius oreades]